MLAQGWVWTALVEAMEKKPSLLVLNQSKLCLYGCLTQEWPSQVRLSDTRVLYKRILARQTVPFICFVPDHYIC